MSGSASAVAQSVLQTTEALRAACADPADAVTLLIALATYSDDVPDSPAQEAAASLCRRAALASLALACADYQPPSADAAQALLATVSTLYDGEAQIAADAFDSAAYGYLKDLRTAVVTDLGTRAESLPYLRTVTTLVPTPSLVLAYQLYEDTTRADEIAELSDAPHPGFLPLSIQVLSF